MVQVMRNSWALLLGLFLLMLGNGLQGTLLGVRGDIEGMSPQSLSWVMMGYFIGFLGGARLTPSLIKSVGHVRVYAALGSLISAAFILFAAWTNPYAWFVLRVIVGFCFSGVYVVAESWLNDASSNETRGQTLSIYMMTQMLGIVLAQVVLNLADPAGYDLFVVISVVVSLSFAPVLLTAGKVPAFEATKAMSLRGLWEASQLGVVGVFSLGLVFSALFGMSAVFGTSAGLSVAEISIFVAAIYLGGVVAQYPIGWLSDHMDRRVLIAGLSMLGLLTGLIGWLAPGPTLYFVAAFILGGIANPLYSLCIAYTNDYLELEDMAAASGGLIFVMGVGSIPGAGIVGVLIGRFGAESYFAFLGAVFGLLGSYAFYRMTRREAIAVEDTNSYAPIQPQASPVAMEVAQEVAIDRAVEEEKMQEQIQEVLSFWFEDTPQEHWYDGPKSFDDQIRTRFLKLYEQAASGELSDWEESGEGSLALLILIDQFSRNMFRGDGRSFAADPEGLRIAKQAIDSGFDMAFGERERAFFYLPLMHSEELSDQDLALAYNTQRLSGEPTHALAHRWVIETFGRFPYRNQALGRETTPDEQAFLDAGGYGEAMRIVQQND